MKRTPLNPSTTPLARGKGLKQSRKRLQGKVERDWSDARAKVEREGACRVCGRESDLESAHTIGREHDEVKLSELLGHWGEPRCIYVNPDSIIPLCRKHHDQYDKHERDILHLLSLPEQLDAVKRVGGLELARKRLCPSAYEGKVGV